jgi:hypothetical protein
MSGGFGNASVSADGYLGAVAVTGTAMWAATEAIYRFAYVDADLLFVGPAGVVTVAWGALFLAWVVLGAVGLEPGVSRSVPSVAWLVAMTGAFAANAAAFVVDGALRAGLMWLPWYVGMAVAYVATGVLVRRGRVYVVAGLGCAAGAVVGLGLVPGADVGPARPFYLPFAVLGVLHGTPMLIDAVRGGRDLAEDGVPELAESAAEAVSVRGD